VQRKEGQRQHEVSQRDELGRPPPQPLQQTISPLAASGG
jgi:hypothetical protein